MRNRRLQARAALAVSALALLALSPLARSPTLDECNQGICTMRMTGPELLAEAERLVNERKFDEARPMLDALTKAPELSLETRFLQGYVAAETGDLAGAARYFRAVLRDRPDVTRARLELARVLMLDGKDAAADHHFRLAEEDRDLPAEIERTIRNARGVLRNRKNWSLNVDVGFAPDTNINNATDARTVDILYGGTYQKFILNQEARARSGVGQTGAVSGSVRLRLSDGKAMLIDADGQVTNYKGNNSDDISALIAAGPELTMRDGSRFSVQALGARRWYGGKVAARSIGARASFQKNLAAGQRVGVQIDVRKTASGYGDIYSGWNYAGYATYERVLRRSLVASGTVFARREDLNGKAYSSTEFGASAGIGGELPLGLNAGLSAGISRVLFDAPILAFGTERRKDWRLNGRAYLGARSIRVLGFSPSVTYTYNRLDASYDLYKSDRHRVQFGLARYF